ncbi:MAG TPA: DUF4288 domain-containing protein [Tepidisphaeraceae bacterium]|jgi:hypothetical protein
MASARGKRTSRYAAKLLFQFRVVTGGRSNKRRLCEERIVLVNATTARIALATAKRRGAAAVLHYQNPEGDDVHFEFVGVLDLIHLGLECEPGEVWWEMRHALMPSERRKRIIPSDRELLSGIIDGR